MGNTVAIDKLPLDVVVYILLHYLPLNSIVVLSSVSKEFSSYFNQDVLWKRLCLEWLHHESQLDPGMLSWKHQFIYSVCHWVPFRKLNLKRKLYKPYSHVTNSRPMPCNISIWKSRISNSDYAIMLGFDNSFHLHLLKTLSRNIRKADLPHLMMPYGAYAIGDYLNYVAVKCHDGMYNLSTISSRYPISEKCLKFVALHVLEYLQSCEANNFDPVLDPSDIYVLFRPTSTTNILKICPYSLLTNLYHKHLYPTSQLNSRPENMVHENQNLNAHSSMVSNWKGIKVGSSMPAITLARIRTFMHLSDDFVSFVTTCLESEASLTTMRIHPWLGATSLQELAIENLEQNLPIPDSSNLYHESKDPDYFYPLMITDFEN